MHQLQDMQAAGIDVALPVFWGDDLDWSIGGLDTMVQAREEILLAGGNAPALGLFLDTNFLARVLVDRPDLADLSSDDGIDFMTDQAAAFFAHVPACHLLNVDDRPVVFVWRPDTEDGSRFTFDGNVFTVLEDRLAERIGTRPLIVRERTWDARAAELNVTLDPGPVFGWGAALAGPLVEQQTVAVGPGYDDRLLPGRTGYVREREDGAAFEHDLRVATLSGAPWLLLETWNEQWEATAIAETAELGRRYIGLAGEAGQLFHNFKPELPRDAWVELGDDTSNYLQLLADAPEEKGTPSEHAGKWGSRPLFETDEGAAYFHFGLPPRLRPNGLRTASVDVEYLDSGGGSFGLQYESAPELETDEVYTESERVGISNSGQWRHHRFFLPDVNFERRQYGGYGDFRIQDLPADGELPHVFGLVILSSDHSPHPVTLAPETLSAISSATSVPLTFQWSGLEHAETYRLEIAPLNGTNVGETFISDGRRCGSHSESPGDEDEGHRCADGDISRLPTGLYEWRVEALDKAGNLLGTPSDWSYLIRK
jgi:hypothetical protein